MSVPARRTALVLALAGSAGAHAASAALLGALLALGLLRPPMPDLRKEHSHATTF